MQVRFREWDDRENKYKLINYIDVEDYDVLVKFLQIAQINAEKTGISVEVNLSDVADSDDVCAYNVKSVSLVIPKIGGYLLPHIAVDVEQTY